MFLKTALLVTTLFFSTLSFAKGSISYYRTLFANGTITSKDMRTELTRLKGEAVSNSYRAKLLDKELTYLELIENLEKADKEEQLKMVNNILDSYYQIAKSSFEQDQFISEQVQALYLMNFIKAKDTEQNESVKSLAQCVSFLGNRLRFNYDNAQSTYQALSDKALKDKFKVIFKRFVTIDYNQSKGQGMPDSAKFFVDL